MFWAWSFISRWNNRDKHTHTESALTKYKVNRSVLKHTLYINHCFSVRMCNTCYKHSHKMLKLKFNLSGLSTPSLRIILDNSKSGPPILRHAGFSLELHWYQIGVSTTLVISLYSLLMFQRFPLMLFHFPADAPDARHACT